MLLVDTGVLLAAADSSDRDHTACAELLQGAERPLLTSPLVVAETGYLIERQLGSRAEAWGGTSSVAASEATTASRLSIPIGCGSYGVTRRPGG